MIWTGKRGWHRGILKPSLCPCLCSASPVVLGRPCIGSGPTLLPVNGTINAEGAALAQVLDFFEHCGSSR